MKGNIYQSKVCRCDGAPILKIKIHSSSDGELEDELCRNAEEFASGRLFKSLERLYRANEDADKRFYVRYVYTFSIVSEDAFDGRIRFLNLSASLASEKERQTIAKKNRTVAINTKNGEIVPIKKFVKTKKGREKGGIYKRITLGEG